MRLFLIRFLLLPLIWLLAAAAAVYGMERFWLWQEIFTGWGIVCLNALLSGAAGLAASRGPVSSRTPRILKWHAARTMALFCAIIFLFRLDFLNFPAFLTASLTGYFLWMAGHISTLYRQ